MNGSKFTPGPWTRGCDGGDVIWGPEWKGDRVQVACVPFRHGCTRTEADARLIAAAPELLHACELIAHNAPMVAQWLAFNDPKALEQVKAAIAKATGEEE